MLILCHKHHTVRIGTQLFALGTTTLILILCCIFVVARRWQMHVLLHLRPLTLILFCCFFVLRSLLILIIIAR